MLLKTLMWVDELNRNIYIFLNVSETYTTRAIRGSNQKHALPRNIPMSGPNGLSSVVPSSPTQSRGSRFLGDSGF